MSDLTPFGTGQGIEATSEVRADVTIFKAPLDGFDWAAYEQRQVRIDALREDPEALAQLLDELSSETSSGAMLNNLHDRTIGGVGNSYSHLTLPLTVMSASLLEADAPHMDFEAGIGVETSFADRHLSGANFNNSVMPDASFRQADLRGASMVNAVLNGVNFEGANLSGVDARGAYLIDVRGLTQEQILGMDLRGARVVSLRDAEEGDAMRRVLASRFGNYTDLADIVEVVDPVAVSIDQSPPKLTVARDLKGMVASRLNAREVDFTASNLVGATIDDFVAARAILRTTVISGARLRQGTLKEADLFGVWAPGVLIEDVSMQGANLSGSNLAGSLLRSVDLRHAVGLEATATNTQGIVLDDVKLPSAIGYDGNSLQPSDKLRRQLEM